jgi:beta-phosphoglucomutase
LSRDVRWQSPAGRTVDVHFERFASLDDPHLLVVRCQVTPLDFSGTIKVQAGLSGYAENEGVLHWRVVGQGSDASKIWLHLATRHTGIELGMASALSVEGGGDTYQRAIQCAGLPAHVVRCHARPDKTISLTRVVAAYTSRDLDRTPVTPRPAHPGAPDPLQAAQARLSNLSAAHLAYRDLFSAHAAAWAGLWRDCDVVVEGDPDAQLALRYNLFQTLIAAPRRDDAGGGGKASIGAKTLSGFGYRGHVFWDTEIFIVPFLTHTQPDVARDVLTYRYYTLPGARRKARTAGYEGAWYAWESADTGDEVTPRWVPDPHSGELVRIWPGDIELHLNADVAYAVWRYWQATGDDEWMRHFGAEIVLDTAVFWGSRAGWNEARARYELCDVIGPDEYHDHVNNNAFTNEMVRWHLETALHVLGWLRRHDSEHADELARRLDLSTERLRRWTDVIGCMFVPHDPESRLIEQFEGFFDLEDVDLEVYEPRVRSMQAILGIEGANRVQVIKQADVLMLLYLLPDRYDADTLRTNWDYYAPRTDHTYGSSLGPCIHAILACEVGSVQEAYEHFMRAALVDLQDVRGNTADGIHAASAGGLWQSAVFGFGGVRLTPDGPVAHPRLPAHWTRLKFRLCYRGQWYDFDLQPAASSQQPAVGDPQLPTFPIPHFPTSPLPDIRGVIFDLDGVLTDTSEFHYLGWQRLADEEGLPFDRQANEALRGIARRDSLLRLLDGRPATEEEIREMMARKNRYYQQYIEDVTPENLLPGALSLLKELRAARVKVAIGSASKNAATVIERLGIGDLVDVISDGYSVEQQKPAPDLFLHAADQLRLPPGQCVVVEDAASGVEAALAAGAWAVGIGPQERVGKAHVVLPDLRDVRWVDLKARLLAADRRGNPK